MDLHVTTDDGSYVRKGFVTDVLREVIEQKGDIALCIAIGPPPMTAAVANLTRKYNLKTSSAELAHGGRHGYVRLLPVSVAARQIYLR